MNKEELIQLLKTDVAAFNTYRRETEFAPIDLTGTNLTGTNLTGTNLTCAYLRGADLTDADLRGANLEDANLTDADLTCAYLRDADLTDANLRGADLTRANLRGANLRGANLDYSCIPLWCGSLRMKTDERQRKQIAYHLASLFVHAESISDEEKTIYRAIANYANGFHRIGECPELEPNL